MLHIFIDKGFGYPTTASFLKGRNILKYHIIEKRKKRKMNQSTKDSCFGFSEKFKEVLCNNDLRDRN